MVSLKQIAEQCGVSVASVSKALNNHKDIGESTKERIRQTAAELGYYPNAAARTLKTNRSYNIGVLFADAANSGLTHDYFSAVLESFKTAAFNPEKYDYQQSAVTRPAGDGFIDEEYLPTGAHLGFGHNAEGGKEPDILLVGEAGVGVGGGFQVGKPSHLCLLFPLLGVGISREENPAVVTEGVVNKSR